LDILVNSAGLMLIGPVEGAVAEELGAHDRHQCQRPAPHHPRCPPHLLKAAEEGPRQFADIVNVSSVAGRFASSGFGVNNLTKFGVNGFSESMRQEVTRRHVRVGVVQPANQVRPLANR
jgi:NADP-dependent 3-hydroxy acid dehydrogenase YdfG